MSLENSSAMILRTYLTLEEKQAGKLLLDNKCDMKRKSSEGEQFIQEQTIAER